MATPRHGVDAMPASSAASGLTGQKHVTGRSGRLIKTKTSVVRILSFIFISDTDKESTDCEVHQ